MYVLHMYILKYMYMYMQVLAEVTPSQFSSAKVFEELIGLLRHEDPDIGWLYSLCFPFLLGLALLLLILLRWSPFHPPAQPPLLFRF